MKILYDYQIFSEQKYGGISRYFSQIISNLPKNFNIEIALKYSDNEYLNFLKTEAENKEAKFIFHNLKSISSYPGKTIMSRILNKINSTKQKRYISANQNLCIEKLKQQDFDVFHPTYYDDYFLSYIGKKPFVLTIHDMIHELYPEMLKDVKIINQKSRLAKRADHIIAVSENTKHDIIEILNVPKEKISVIYHANSLQTNDFIEIDLPKKYFLYIGKRSDYKNFIFFIFAINQILKKNPDLNVICVGRNFDKMETEWINGLGLQNQLKTKILKDNELSFFYKNALALILPSYAEGFGIPILEAFALNCPVVLSNTSSLTEIAGEAALYFDPKSVISIRNSVQKILSDSYIRKFLISKGLERSKKFSWNNSALETAKVYQKVI